MLASHSFLFSFILSPDFSILAKLALSIENLLDVSFLGVNVIVFVVVFLS